MMIQSWRAAFHPFTTLLSLGLALTRSSPIEQPGRDDPGCAAIAPRTSGAIGSSALGEAEDDLVVGIVERENRAQRLARERLDAAQRLHDRHGRRVLRSGGMAPPRRMQRRSANATLRP